jgi:hypothetical protein
VVIVVDPELGEFVEVILTIAGASKENVLVRVPTCNPTEM